jgi:hypothetical protein
LFSKVAGSASLLDRESIIQSKTGYSPIIDVPAILFAERLAMPVSTEEYERRLTSLSLRSLYIGIFLRTHKPPVNRANIA